jgi:hypothetical protein
VRYDSSELDYAGYYSEKNPISADGYDSQHLYLGKGKVIYIANYTGSKDLREESVSILMI